VTIPCVIAWPLDAAQRMLHDVGVSVIAVKQTQPPKGGLEGPLRVVRQRGTTDAVELVVAAAAPLPETEASHG
jgi:hypothetical protein